MRLQLWKAAFHLIAENPILGVGAEGFARSMDALSASGFITPVAAELATQVRSAEGQSCQPEGSAGSSDGAESSDPVESAR